MVRAVESLTTASAPRSCREADLNASRGTLGGCTKWAHGARTHSALAHISAMSVRVLQGCTSSPSTNAVLRCVLESVRSWLGMMAWQHSTHTNSPHQVGKNSRRTSPAIRWWGPPQTSPRIASVAFSSTTPPSPYTVAVYPIQQEPGVWFPTYLIRRYAASMERVVANVTIRGSTHATEREAVRAGIRAGSNAIHRLSTSRVSSKNKVS